jgi:hypothetical protein
MRTRAIDMSEPLSTPRARPGALVLALAAALALLAAGWWWLGRFDVPANGERGTAPAASAAQASDAAPAALGDRAPSPAQTTRAAEGPAETPSATPRAPEPEPTAAPGIGALQVEVVDAAGAPLVELAVHLARNGRAVLEARTDTVGLAHFPTVEAGAWAIRVGGDDLPLVPERAVEIGVGARGPVSIEIPFALVEVDVQVSDDAGRPAPNVALRARCDRGGEPTGVTDHAGRATLRFVQPGMVRVFAQDAHLGRGNQILDVNTTERASAVIALRRRS